MPKSKMEKEFQADEEGTVVVPKEILPAIPETVLKKSVKREMSEKQKANIEKVIAANKERWAKKREEKAKMAEEEIRMKKETEEKLIEAGTHIRVKVKEKPVKAPKASKPLPVRRYEKADSESDTDDIDTVTETETELESEDERPAARKVRREMKKTLRVVEKVNQALSSTPVNPYVAMLQGRWR